MVRVPYCRARSASAMTCLISLMPASTAENSMKSALVMRAMILRQRGLADARRSPEDQRARCRRARSAVRSGFARTEQMLLPDKFVERARTHAIGQRAGAIGVRQRSGWFGKGS